MFGSNKFKIKYVNYPAIHLGNQPQAYTQLLFQAQTKTQLYTLTGLECYLDGVVYEAGVKG